MYPNSCRFSLFSPSVSTLDTFLSKHVLGSSKHSDHFFFPGQPAEPVIIYCMLFSPLRMLLVGMVHGCWLEDKPRELLLWVSFLIILVKNLTVVFSIPECVPVHTCMCVCLSACVRVHMHTCWKHTVGANSE